MTTVTESTEIPPGHPEYANGPWKVRVTDANGCTVESNVSPVVINPIPAAIANNGGAVCEGDAIQLYSNTLTGATYSWYDDDPESNPGANLVSLSQNPTINSLAAGTYTYYLTASQEGCVSPAVATTVDVQSPPTTAPVANYTLATNCAPTDLTLTANATAGSGAIATYSWTGPNNFTSDIQNPTIPNKPCKSLEFLIQ